jgi:hypothetical protein
MFMRLALSKRSTAEPAPRGKPARARGVTPAKSDEQYVGAFARVRLVRAWIGAAAAMVALGYAFATLLDRLLR